MFCSSLFVLLYFFFWPLWQHFEMMTSTLPKGTLGSVTSLLAANLYQGNPDRNHKLWNIASKDTTDTDRSASYLDLHLEIDREGRLRAKLYDKIDDFNFPIVNFPFICSNIRFFSFFLRSPCMKSASCDWSPVVQSMNSHVKIIISNLRKAWAFREGAMLPEPLFQTLYYQLLYSYTCYTKPKYPEKTAESHWQILSHNIVTSTPPHERDSNSQR
jgi:hypothetical protein